MGSFAPDNAAEKGAPRRRIKLLRIITRMDLGGSAVDVIDLIKGMNRERFESHLVCGSVSQLDGEELGELKAACASFTLMPELKRNPSPANDIKALWKLYRLIRRERFDIVHAHTSKAGFIGRLAAHLAGAPVVVYSTHGHIFYGFFGKLKTKIFVALEKIGARCSDLIFCLTDLEIEDHLKLGIGWRELFITMPSGVPLEKFESPEKPPEEVKKQLGIPAGSPVIGTVARLDPIKGGKYLVEAFAQLKDIEPAPHLLLVGDGEDRAALEALARELGVGTRARFTGLRRDVPDLLHAMDVFAMPSLNEGYGKAIVEAMCAGRAIVATAVGGVPSLIESGVNGILVPPADSAALAGAIKSILESPEIAGGLSAAALAGAGDKFSVTAMNRATEHVYFQLLVKKMPDLFL
ncbi:MAG: glycosyltransferase family 4 protein [bacterium]